MASVRWRCWKVSKTLIGRRRSTPAVLPGSGGHEARLLGPDRGRGTTLAQHDARAARRAEGDAAAARRLRRRARRRQLEPPERAAEHDLHLLQGEARAQAAPAPAPEWDPGVRSGGLPEEALGPEGIGLRIDLRVVVDEEDARQQRDARRVL